MNRKITNLMSVTLVLSASFLIGCFGEYKVSYCESKQITDSNLLGTYASKDKSTDGKISRSEVLIIKNPTATLHHFAFLSTDENPTITPFYLCKLDQEFNGYSHMIEIGNEEKGFHGTLVKLRKKSIKIQFLKLKEEIANAQADGESEMEAFDNQSVSETDWITNKTELERSFSILNKKK